ncbi:regulator of (H+)-ATPase in vacuolar membrane, partial [Nowakowskiella sp. JEL0078]
MREAPKDRKKRSVREENLYASRSSVLVYTSDFAFKQSLHCDAFNAIPDLSSEIEVSAVAGNTTGFIAASLHSMVFLFAPESNSVTGLTSWIFLTSFHHSSKVNWLSWSVEGSLLVSGQTLRILRKSENFDDMGLLSNNASWEILWDIKLSTSAIKADFSPTGMMFASMGMSDRLIKIWRPSKSSEKSASNKSDSKLIFSFIYLNHPRAVVSIEWRSVSSKNRLFSDNVLLTVCLDKITRLWVESVENPGNFSLSAVIDPFHLPSTVPGGDLDDRKHSDIDNIPIVHWLNRVEILNIINSRESSELDLIRRGDDSEEKVYDMKMMKNLSSHTNLLKRRSKKLRDAMRDYSDLLFLIDTSGSIILWGIQNLTGHPRRVPKVLMLMKSENCVPPSHSNFFTGNLIMFNKSFMSQKPCKDGFLGLYFPAELTILGMNSADGCLNCYAADLDDFFASSWSPSFRLLQTYFGHRYPINNIVCHPNLPLVASIDEGGDCIIYEISSANNQLNSTSTRNSIQQLAWIPQGPMLLIQQNNYIYIYNVKSTNQPLGILPGFDKSLESPLRFLQTYFNPESSEGDFKQSFFVIGVTKDQSAFLWSVNIIGNNNLIDTELILKQKLSFISETGEYSNIQFCVPTDDLCATYYPNFELGAHLFLTFSKDLKFRFWHFGNGNLSDSRTIVNESLLFLGDHTTSMGNNTILWRMLNEFEIDHLPDIVETDPFGKITRTAKFLENGTTDLRVFTHEVTGFNLKEEWRSTLHEKVVGLDWFLSSDGQHLLAAGLLTSIIIFCRKRSLQAGDKPEWIQINQINLPGSDIVRVVKWLSNGSILVGTN